MAEAAATTTTTTTTAEPWFKGADDVMVGHLKNRGWDTKPANEVALEAVKAWKEAEKYIGAPANEIVRLPKEANDPGWKNVWQRLGAPADPKEYDFSNIKRADGTALDEAFTETMRATVHRLNLPKDAAAQLVAEFSKTQDAAKTSEVAARTAAIAEQRAALKKNWGANEAANLFVAQRAAAALGLDAQTVSNLESQIGYDKIMEMFRVIGTKIGEDKFISGQRQAQGGAMTREEAQAKKSDLMKDKGWVERYNKGDVTAKNEMLALNIIITGDTDSPVKRAA